MSDCPECGGFEHGGYLLHWDGCSQQRADTKCYFCDAPGPHQNCYWTATVLPTHVTMPNFYIMCRACKERPKHIIDAIIANGGKPPD